MEKKFFFLTTIYFPIAIDRKLGESQSTSNVASRYTVGDRGGRFFFQNAITGVFRQEPGSFFIFSVQGVRLNTVQLETVQLETGRMNSVQVNSILLETASLVRSDRANNGKREGFPQDA